MIDALVIILCGGGFIYCIALGVTIFRADTIEYKLNHSISKSLKSVFKGELNLDHIGYTDTTVKEGICINKNGEWTLQNSISEEAIEATYN